MNKRRCGLAFAAVTVLLIAVGVWLNFALSYERERAISPDGKWIAIAYINGMPLTAENERVHLWRWWQPHFQWLGCQILEAKNESPTHLLWRGSEYLSVQHGFRPNELMAMQDRCASVRAIIEKKFAPYT